MTADILVPYVWTLVMDAKHMRILKYMKSYVSVLNSTRLLVSWVEKFIGSVPNHVGQPHVGEPGLHGGI